MRKFYFLALVLLQLACEKTEKDTFSFTGDLMGHITGDSLHWYNGSHNPGNVQVIFDRGNQVFTTTSDSSGNFEYRNIPYGTYNITLLKENYVPTFNPGYQLYFTNPVNEDWFTIFKKKRIENIHVELISSDGLFFHQVICEGEFGEDERVELIIFLHETEEADYNNYTSYRFMDYSYCEYCINDLFLYSDSISSSAYYAIYPIVGFNYPHTNWHVINELRDYPIVFDRDINYKGFYDKNNSHATF